MFLNFFNSLFFWNFVTIHAVATTDSVSLEFIALFKMRLLCFKILMIPIS